MIRVKHFNLSEGPAITVMIEGTDSCRAFVDLIQRGSNLWDQASAEMKTLADLVTNKQEMQPYASITVKNKTADCEHDWSPCADAYAYKCLKCCLKKPML